MTLKYITFSISIAFISWIVGMVLNSILMKTKYYEKLGHLTFIKSKKLNKNIGLDFFKWIVINTPFKFFNQKLKLKRKAQLKELITLRKEMTFSEISHLIGFAFVCVFVIIKIVNTHYVFAFIIMLVNLLMNLYPSLLQQENKRRIDILIKRYETTEKVANR